MRSVLDMCDFRQLERVQLELFGRPLETHGAFRGWRAEVTGFGARWGRGERPVAQGQPVRRESSGSDLEETRRDGSVGQEPGRAEGKVSHVGGQGRGTLAAVGTRGPHLGIGAAFGVTNSAHFLPCSW